MEEGMSARFEQNEKTIAALLVSTGDRDIRFGAEKSSFKDPFWGWDNGNGKNAMGKLLMKLRVQLKVWIINTICLPCVWRFLTLCFHLQKQMDKKGIDVQALVADLQTKKSDDNYSVEYSRTKTATWYVFLPSFFVSLFYLTEDCSKQCEKKLEKGVLRIGKKAIIRNSLSWLWYHWECFFKRYSVASDSIAIWKGFKEIKPVDQEQIIELAKKTAEQGGARTALTSSTGHVKEYTADCVAGYASSSRSTCKWCKTSIERNALRFLMRVFS